MSLAITIKGAKQVQRVLKDAQKQSQKRMKDAVRETAKNIRRRAKRNLAKNRRSSTAMGNYTRETSKGLKFKVRGTSGKVTAPFPGHIIEGGADPFFPPPDALEEWAASKLGDPNLAFPVARAISERGLEASPFLNPAAEAERSDHRRRVNQALFGISGITRG